MKQPDSKIVPKTELPPLLYICHRIPYPPDKGDKIRSYNMLKGLAEHYRLFLGAYIEDPADWAGVDFIGTLCEDVCVVGLSAPKKIMRAGVGFLFGKSLTTSCYKDRTLKRWVGKVVSEHSIDAAVAFSSGVAPLLSDLPKPPQWRIIDFVDVDSKKWSQYAQLRQWPIKMIFERESRLLLKVERETAAQFNKSIFVSKREAELFISYAPEAHMKVTYVENGVDYEHLSPVTPLPDPYHGQSKIIIFTGAMDYWPNVDAVQYFSANVMPLLLAVDPEWRFYIVGSSPSSQVLDLHDGKCIFVTGRVDDMRPWLASAKLAVAPMRLARGVQNKVLEAMSMALPVVASSEALEGIEAKDNTDVIIANEPQEYVKAILEIGAGENHGMGISARNYVVNNHSWKKNTDILVRIVKGCQA